MDSSYDVITYFNTFASIIKIVTMFIKTIFKDSKKVKRIRNDAPKYNLSVFCNIAKFADFR